jgi:choloylglycine hydrolase
MTNEPPLKEQLENLRQYEGFGGNKPLPGTTKPQDRFVRASYYLKYLPKPKNLREALAGVFSITRNVSQPFRVSVDPKHPNISSTLWSTVADLTNGTYYFESTSSPYLIWVNIHEFDLNDGASVMKLDLTNNPDFAGDVTQHFMQTKSFEFMSSVQSEKTK